MQGMYVPDLNFEIRVFVNEQFALIQLAAGFEILKWR
jgi:hypothetical protein